MADRRRVWGVAIAAAAAGLEVAARYGLPTARLIASDVVGARTGECALLETVLRRYAEATRPTALHSAGAVLAEVHSIRMKPAKRLPLRLHHNPYDDCPADRRRGGSPTSPLLEEADRILRGVAPPNGEMVFVHGDPWFDNMLWDDSRCLRPLIREALCTISGSTPSTSQGRSVSTGMTYDSGTDVYSA